MKSGLVDGSRYGWRGALVFPDEYFDSGATYTLVAAAGAYALTGSNATLTYTSAGGTVGDDTAGASTFPASNDRGILSDFTMPADGDGVTGYLRFDSTSTAGTNAKFLVYANGAGVPGALLYASTAQAVPAGGGILTYSVSVPGLTNGQVIWLGGVTDSFQAVWQTDASGGLSRMEGMNYASPDATWTESGTGSAQVNAWMDYTSGGGGGPTYTLTAESGTFALTGAAAGLIYARRIQADSGSFALTGAAANLVRGRRLVADAGTYALTGAAAGLVYGRRLVADSGAFTLTGADATLVYTPVGGYTLVADPGSFTFTGQPANLVYGRRLQADAGSYSLTGSDATLTYTQVGGYTLTAESGSYSFAGSPATLTYSGQQDEEWFGQGQTFRHDAKFEPIPRWFAPEVDVPAKVQEVAAAARVAPDYEAVIARYLDELLALSLAQQARDEARMWFAAQVAEEAERQDAEAAFAALMLLVV